MESISLKRIRLLMTGPLAAGCRLLAAAAWLVGWLAWFWFGVVVVGNTNINHWYVAGCRWTVAGCCCLVGHRLLVATGRWPPAACHRPAYMCCCSLLPVAHMSSCAVAVCHCRLIVCCQRSATNTLFSFTSCQRKITWQQGPLLGLADSVPQRRCASWQRHGGHCGPHASGSKKPPSDFSSLSSTSEESSPSDCSSSSSLMSSWSPASSSVASSGHCSS